MELFSGPWICYGFSKYFLCPGRFHLFAKQVWDSILFFLKAFCIILLLQSNVIEFWLFCALLLLYFITYTEYVTYWTIGSAEAGRDSSSEWSLNILPRSYLMNTDHTHAYYDIARGRDLVLKGMALNHTWVPDQSFIK
jgi:hypothetical protein